MPVTGLFGLALACYTLGTVICFYSILVQQYRSPVLFLGRMITGTTASHQPISSGLVSLSLVLWPVSLTLFGVVRVYRYCRRLR